MEDVLGFHSEEYYFLSNFYTLPGVQYVEIEGELYVSPTSEHYFQMLKCVRHEDRLRISLLGDPKVINYIGGKVELRSDWDVVKVGEMFKVLKWKFSIEDLASRLLATGNKNLLEVNSWGDTYWGVNKNLVGKNHLGKLLMEVRGLLRNNGEP